MKRIHIENMSGIFDSDADDLLALDEALRKLEYDDSQASQVAKLRLFSGLTIDDMSKKTLSVH